RVLVQRGFWRAGWLLLREQRGRPLAVTAGDGCFPLQSASHSAKTTCRSSLIRKLRRSIFLLEMPGPDKKSVPRSGSRVTSEASPVLAVDIVFDFIQRVTDCKFCRDFRNRKSRCLRRQRAGTRVARVHFDYDHPAVVRIHRKLNVRPAGLHTDLANDGERGVA